RIATPTVVTSLAFPWLGDATGSWESRLALTSAGTAPAALRWTPLGGSRAATAPTSAPVPPYGSVRWDYPTDNAAAPGIGATGTTPATGGPVTTGPAVLGAVADGPAGLAGVLQVRPADESIASGPIAAVAYPGQQGGASQLWVPLLSDVAPAGVSWETRVVVQNLGEQTARVRATWLLQGAETRADERVVEAGRSARIGVPPATGGGVVESLGGQLLAGVALATASSGAAAAYLLPTGGSGRVLLPVFGAASGWAGAVSIMNTGDALAEVRLRWGAYGGGLGAEERVSLPPRGVARLPRDGAQTAGAF